MNFRAVLIYFLGVAALLSFGCSSEKQQQEQTGQTVKSGEQPSGVVTYQAPAGWKEVTPGSSMRKAEFVLPGVDGNGDATLAVFYFPGTGGSVEANLHRWYNQFKQPDDSQTSQHVEKKEMKVGNLPVTVVYVTGTFLQAQSQMMMQGPVEEKPDYALLAAIAETGSGPWFFKATGPQPTIDHWRSSFMDFVKSFKVEQS